jgi:cyclophilin family peptidyl-prolyl cis-trans isomerase
LWIVFGALLVMLTVAACGADDLKEVPSNGSGLTPTPTTTTAGDTPVAKQYDAPPAMTLDTTHSYTATFKTSKGDIVVELFADKAPITVNNFVFLARESFYDNTVFHRVLADFMAQGGDPTGTGTGGPGYRFEDEFDASLKHTKPGILSMANAGPNTNGSQFFLTFVPTPHLDNKHTVFGQVIEGLDIMLSLTLRDPQRDQYPGDALETIVIDEKG